MGSVDENGVDENGVDENGAGRPPDPVERLMLWLDEARASGTSWSQVMVLATAAASGRPSARAVVLRGIGAGGVVFFSDEDSRKGVELLANPVAAAVFLLPGQRRQVRLEGRVEQLGEDDADESFRGRPRFAQLAVWGWRQGQLVGDRQELQRGLEQARRHFAGRAIPRPRYWRGYVLRPEVVELWEERAGGFPERDRFVLASDRGWLRELPAP